MSPAAQRSRVKLVVTKCDGSSPGETKVVVVPHSCSFAELVRCLKSRFLPPKEATAAAAVTTSSESSTQQGVSIRYCLPSDPRILVDVRDDEDVASMVDEHYTLGGSSHRRPQMYFSCGSSGPSLWPRSGSGSGHGSGSGAATYSLPLSRASTATLEALSPFSRAMAPLSSSSASSSYNPAAIGLAPSAVTRSTSAVSALGLMAPPAAASHHDHFAFRPPLSPPRSGLIGRMGSGQVLAPLTPPRQPLDSASSSAMLSPSRRARPATLPPLAGVEVIPAESVTLVTLLGAGSYGDMWRGRWREAEVAVKCLSPVALGVDCFPSEGCRDDAAERFISRFAKSVMLRHPNLVQFYGIVLPSAPPPVLPLTPRSLAPLRSLSFDAAPRGPGHDDQMATATVQQQQAWPEGDDIRRTASLPAGRLVRGGITPPAPALVTEYVGGQSLLHALSTRDPLVASRRTRVSLALDVTKAMVYVHSKGVTHGDLKSSNVNVCCKGRGTVARVSAAGVYHTGLQGYVPGVTTSPNVLPWLAPEVLWGPHKVTNKVDVFAFGIILWELWALAPPYASEAAFGGLLRAVTDPSRHVRPPIPGSAPDAPPMPEPASGWKELMKSCWAADPDSRPPFTKIASELSAMEAAVRRELREGRNSSPLKPPLHPPPAAPACSSPAIPT
ncbi:hypothetical protein N2152v2_001991 [Parachlorella kessleri]